MKRARLKRGANAGKKKRMTSIKMTPVQKRISDMLKENTGAHFLDSGGAYGRHWQDNQKRTFVREPVVNVDGYKDGDWTIDVSTYHFLTNHLVVSPESNKLNKQFKAFGDKPENEDKPYPELMRMWQEELFQKQEQLVDMYGDDDGTILNVSNSYNADNLIDQVLQYQFFRKDGHEFAILQVHGGADVRGGYTAPQVFELSTPSGEGVADWLINMTGVQASDGVRTFYSDDSGYHWYADMGKDPDLKKWRFDVKKKKVVNTSTGRAITFSVGWA